MLTIITTWHTDWFLSSVLNAHINEMVDRYSALLALRLDFSYKKQTSNLDQSDYHQLEHDIRTLMERMMLEDAVVGYFWVIEYGKDHGFHAHVVFWLDRHLTQRPYAYAERARKLWDEITLLDGGFHRCEFKKHYVVNINLPVYYNDPASVSNIRQVLSYLAKEEQKLAYPMYGCNEVPSRSSSGRPREIGEWQYSSPSVRYSI